MKQFVGNFFEWLLRASWQAAIIVLLVLAIQWLCRKKLSERWRYALWSLVLFRLLLPASIPSNLSLYNLTRLAPSTHAIQPKPVATANITPSTPSPVAQPAITPAIQIELPAPPTHPEPLAVTPPHKPTSLFTKSNLLAVTSLIWFAGALLLLSRILIQNILFSRRLRHSKIITDTTTLALFQDCKSLFNITFPIRLLETSAVRSPALYGFFRPVLLLPSELLSNFTERELRYIFLHELAHVKRRDMAVHWTATLLGLLHWFNPVLWFAFRRMAADRELACDELALSYANEQESKPYGETIIKLLESCAQTAALPGLMGILEDKDQMTRRISMIARFKKHSRRSLPAIVLLLLLGIFTLTDAQSPARPQLTKKATPKVSSGSNTQSDSSESPMKYQLLAVEGEPIVNATLRYSGATRSEDLKTDTNGIIEIPPNYYGGIQFSMSGATTFPSGKVPTGYLMRVIPAIEGTLVDETQKPVVGAKVEFQVPQNAQGQNAKVSFGTNTTVYTDTNGYWVRFTMPTNLENVDLLITHSNYAQKLISLPARTSTNYVIIMQPGPQSQTDGTNASTNSASAGSTKNTQLKFQVLDEISGQPVADATIRAASFREGGKSSVSMLKTDTNGLAFIDILPAPYSGMTIFATANGYVPMSYAPTRFGKIPASHLMHLAPATPIGGIVVDEAQKPIVGAKIEFHGPGIDIKQVENVSFGPDTTTQSDSSGHWTCSMMPTNLEKMTLVLTHSNYARTITTVAPNTPSSTKSVIVMKTSPIVFGTVTDLNGNPIKEATIREVHNYGQPKVSTKSDEDGKFSLKNLKYGELDVVVQANGFAPQLLSTIATNTPTEINFKLAPGHRFRGRVVDESGNPITNAVVQTDSDNQGLRKVEWSTRTDNDGRFEWNSAPAEPLFYWIEARGYATIRMKSYKADGSDQIITLQKPGASKAGQTLITGTVVDEETGAPLNDFKVLLGQQTGMPTEFEFATEGNEGSFKCKLPSPIHSQEYQIQIQKEGYLPVASTNLLVSAGNQTLTFKLHKGSGPSGIVLLPDGSPAGNATVFFCDSTGIVYMDKPRQFRKDVSRADITITDADGRFSFSPKLDARCFIVIHDQGYAEVPFTSFYTPGKITLQPWGRVEGQLLIGTKPGASQTISLENILYRVQPDGRPFAALSLWLTTTTDANGRFVIEKAPPGEHRIVHRLPSSSPGPIHESHGIPINVAAGTITKVQLGGTGQLVKGKALLPAINKTIDWGRSSASLTTKISDPLASPPKREDYASNDELIAAYKKYNDTSRAFWSSEKGRALDRARQTFMAPLNPDGSFLIPDVPAGTYELKITINESEKNSIRPNSGFHMSKPLASVTQDVTIPEVPGGFSEDPLDLGTLKLKAAEGGDPKPLKPALKQAQNIRGKVLLPDGTPASRAEVVLGTKENGTVLGDRHFLDRERSITMDTLSDGSFNLGPAPDAHALFVTHDSGFAQVDLEDPVYPLTIKLQPWGRVEGTLFTGGKPVANQKVALFAPFSIPNVGGLGLSRDFFNVEADSQGKFSFEHVPPIEVSVCRIVPCGWYSPYAEPQFVEVQPGTTTNVVHNPVGRIITGQFVNAAGSGSLHWTNQNIGFLGKKMDGSLYSRLATSEGREWVMYYLNSPGGKISVRTRQQFPVIVNPDGTFKMENVPPGTYNLDINFFEPFKIPVQSLGKQIASLHKEITIPASETGNPYQAFDLGKLEVEPVKNSSYR